jgi:hypothetical protein
MTQPTGPASGQDKKEHDRQKQRMERGARTRLDVRRRYPAPAIQLGPQGPASVEIPRSGELAGQLGEPGFEAHLVVQVRHLKTPQFALSFFFNTPSADPQTPPTVPGHAGALAFFEPSEDDAGHHGDTSIRLPVTATLKRLGTWQSLTLTLVPVGYPGRDRGRNATTVTASLGVVTSEVVP